MNEKYIFLKKIKKLKKLLTFVCRGVILSKQANQRQANKITYGVLAQLGEHLPYKQRVIGSSPIGPIHYQFNMAR